MMNEWASILLVVMARFGGDVDHDRELHQQKLDIPSN